MPFIYFITTPVTETGKKFRELELKVEECFQARKKFLKKYGVKEYRPHQLDPFGGVCSCFFDNEPSLLLWRRLYKGENEYLPNKKTKEGKALFKELDELPTVTSLQLNMCIGFNAIFFKRIGYNSIIGKLYGFSLNTDWGIKVPSDCTELTYTEYAKTFKIKPKK